MAFSVFHPSSWFNRPTNAFPVTPQPYQRVNGQLYNNGGEPNTTQTTVNGQTYDAAGDPIGGGGGGGTTTGGSGGSAVPSAPNYSQQFTDALGNLTGVYNQMFGNYNTAAGDRANQIMQNYGLQNQGLNNQYAQNQQILPNAYGARGLGSSSYFENALKQSGDQYNLGQQQLTNAERGDLANVAQTAAQARSGGQAKLGYYNNLASNFGNYSPADQQYLLSQLNNDLTGAQAEVNNPQTQQGFLDLLGKITPYQSTAASQLKTQLDALTGANTTSAAKNQIAQGLIQNSQIDPNQTSYWNSYWQSLLG